MKNIEQIIVEIEEINQIAKNISSAKIFLKPFWKFYFLLKFLPRKFLFNFFISPAFLLFAVFTSLIFMFYLFDFYILSKFEDYLNEYTATILAVGFLFFLLFIWVSLSYFSQKISEKYDKKVNEIINWWNYFSGYDFIKNFLIFPKNISLINQKIVEFLQHWQKDYQNFLSNSEQILQFSELTSSHFQKIQKYFDPNYVKEINFLIFRELELLKKFLNFSLENQINEHNKIIFSIENLEKNEWKNFSEILNLQKVRLEKQKTYFENLINKNF